ncbi:hypothetical protein AAFN88_05825 [Pelagibius sp. CAU 1746]|uniref:hypothetical protein n=1 Tax=Pelagibius sp. CAU 1746 TaxID=3140370 RepID=UPI00325B7D71
MATPNFIFLPVADAGHGNVIRFAADATKDRAEAEARAERKRLFKLALARSIPELRRDFTSNRTNEAFLDRADSDRAKTKHVVFVVHGIRDWGGWMGEFKQELEAQDPTVRVVTSKYGYFPMFRFLLFDDREENVRWFVDQYIETLALYPNAERRSFIGHSNGTYLLASALQNYQAIYFDRVYFAGSVVPSDFGWNELLRARRIGVLRNDIAQGDWVVALGPKFYQQVKNLFGLENTVFFNLGSGGFNGFIETAGHQYVGMLAGGHSAALESPQNRKSIRSFILTGATSGLPRSDGAGMLGVLSNVAWAVWLLAAAAVTALGWAIWRCLAVVRRAGVIVFVAVYAALVFVVLNTV